jgi:hypothetical protein
MYFSCKGGRSSKSPLIRPSNQLLIKKIFLLHVGIGGAWPLLASLPSPVPERRTMATGRSPSRPQSAGWRIWATRISPDVKLLPLVERVWDLDSAGEASRRSGSGALCRPVV